jgi:hypothetical protein
MTRRNRLEDAIQRAVFSHYNAHRARDAVMFAVPNGGVKAGRFHAMELKRQGGRTSQAQKDFLAALEQAGAAVAIADNLDTAIAQLERWGILRGETRLANRSGRFHNTNRNRIDF